MLQVSFADWCAHTIAHMQGRALRNIMHNGELMLFIVHHLASLATPTAGAKGNKHSKPKQAIAIEEASIDP